MRLFHPAFEMVRSSLMILLGFVILLLTFLVTLMVGGKFKQNLKEDLRVKNCPQFREARDDKTGARKRWFRH